jgi:ABC-type spermidine/putrescine transport system permease subunit II
VVLQLADSLRPDPAVPDPAGAGDHAAVVQLGSFLVYPLQGFSLHWYQDFFASAEWMRALKNSIIVAPAATVLAMVFGTLAAIGLTRGDFPARRW